MPEDIADVVGFPVTRLSLPEAVHQANAFALSNGSLRYLACANNHSLAIACRDHRFAAALKCADLLLPDGVAALYAAAIAGNPIPSRVTGPDFFKAFSMSANRRGGISYFFMGSTGQQLERITGRLKHDFPAIEIAGTYSPPFKDEFSEADTEAMIDAIEKAAPTVLWLGMTAPKQEIWLYENRHRLSVPFAGLIGAAFDFYAGTRKRAPRWMQDNSLEWAYRLILEPKRMWRRNFVSGPYLTYQVLRHRMAKSHNKRSRQK